jgi:hypothetical protein
MDLAAGHFYPRSMKIDGRWCQKKCITASGFNYLNTFAGIGFVDPPRVLDDNGVEVQNPIIRRRRGRPEFVRVTKGAVGRANNGTLRLLLLTLTYDVEAYFAADLYRAWNDGKTTMKWGHIANEEVAKQEVLAGKNLSEVYLGSGNCLVYDVSDRDVLVRLGEQNQKSLFADRLAQSIVERNLLKRHFGFTYTDDDGCVEIVCWPQADLNWDSISRSIRTRSEDGFVVLGGEKVAIEEEAVDLTEEDVAEAGVSAFDLDVTESQVAEQEPPKAVSQADVFSLWRLAERKEKGLADRLTAPILQAAGMKKSDLSGVDSHPIFAKLAEALSPK